MERYGFAIPTHQLAIPGIVPSVAPMQAPCEPDKAALLRQLVDEPENPMPAFQLAQAASTQRNFSESHMWWRVTLRRATRLGLDKEWKARALKDPALQAMWMFPGELPWPAEPENTAVAA